MTHFYLSFSLFIHGSGESLFSALNPEIFVKMAREVIYLPKLTKSIRKRVMQVGNAAQRMNKTILQKPRELQPRTMSDGNKKAVTLVVLNQIAPICTQDMLLVRCFF